MKKFIHALLFLFLMSASAHASEQVWFGGRQDSPSTFAARWNNLMGGGSAWNVTESQMDGIVTAAGTIDTLNFVVDSSPGSGRSWIATVRKNAADTDLTCTITNSNTSCSDLTHSVSVSPGDKVSFQVAPSGNPPSTSSRWSTSFKSSAAKESTYPGRNSQSTSGTTYGNPIGGQNGNSSTESAREQIVATSGTIKNLYVEETAAPGSGKSRVMTFRKNGVDQTVACTVSDTATACSDTTNSFTVAAGDIISIKSVASGSVAASSMRFGWTFVSDTDGEFLLAFVVSSGPSNLSTTHFYLVGANDGVDFTDGNRKQLGNACTLKKMYVRFNTAPGSGKSWTANLRKNASTDTSLSVTVSDSNQVGSVTSDVTVLSTDYWNTKLVPSGIPSGSTLHTAFLGYIAPVGGEPDVYSGRGIGRSIARGIGR